MLCSDELWDMFSTCDTILYVDIPYEFVCNICNLRHQSANYCILNYFTTPFVYKTLGRWKKWLKLHFNCVTWLALSALLFLVLTGFQPWSFSSFRTECWKILGLTGLFRVPECLDCGTFGLYSLSQNVKVLEGKWFLTFKKIKFFFFWTLFIPFFLMKRFRLLQECWLKATSEILLVVMALGRAEKEVTIADDFITNPISLLDRSLEKKVTKL